VFKEESTLSDKMKGFLENPVKVYYLFHKLIAMINNKNLEFIFLDFKIFQGIKFEYG